MKCRGGLYGSGGLCGWVSDDTCTSFSPFVYVIRKVMNYIGPTQLLVNTRCVFVRLLPFSIVIVKLFCEILCVFEFDSNFVRSSFWDARCKTQLPFYILRFASQKDDQTRLESNSKTGKYFTNQLYNDYWEKDDCQFLASYYPISNSCPTPL